MGYPSKRPIVEVCLLPEWQTCTQISLTNYFGLNDFQRLHERLIGGYIGRADITAGARLLYCSTRICIGHTKGRIHEHILYPLLHCDLLTMSDLA